MTVYQKFLIKKYINRRMYNMEMGGYISLRDIEKLVKQGHSFEITEQFTQKNVTDQTLLEILREAAKQGRTTFARAWLMDQIKNLPEIAESVNAP